MKYIYKNFIEARWRIVFGFAVLISIFYSPWWMVLVLAIFGGIFFDNYYEIFLFGILVDLLYGASSLSFGGIFGVFTATVIFISTNYIRKSLR